MVYLCGVEISIALVVIIRTLCTHNVFIVYSISCTCSVIGVLLCRVCGNHVSADVCLAGGGDIELLDHTFCIMTSLICLHNVLVINNQILLCVGVFVCLFACVSCVALASGSFCFYHKCYVNCVSDLHIA